MPELVEPDLVVQSVAGLYWEPSEAAKVMVASKSDDLEADLSMWTVGGNTESMKQARNRIYLALHHWWLCKLKQEASA
jgi:hypothetical protein